MTEEIQYRSLEIRADDLADTGEIRLIASTNAPVDVGGYREILSHDAGAVSMESCRSLLLNHDSDQIIGGVRGLELRDGKLMATVFIVESARTASGTSIRELVKAGALRGVSIGYVRDLDKATFDERSNTLTVPKWSLRELTLTPTPADTRAQVVRSLPKSFTTAPNDIVSDATAAPAASQKGSPMADENKPQENTPDAAPKHDEAQRASEIAALRAREADFIRITKLAESHGLRASDFIGKPVDQAIEAMLAAKAAKEVTDVKTERTGDIVLGATQAEKVNAESVESLSTGKSVLSVARRHAAAMGLQTHDMNNADLAAYVLGKDVPGSKRSGPANVTSSNFNTVVLGNFMDKAVQNGFSAGVVTYPAWTNRRVVSDFKTFAAGALDSGNLVSTAENLAFPELAKAEHSYSSALGMWGATISLTFQALVNDDLGEFTRMLNRSGQIAARTVEKEVVRVLEAMTWTGNLTSALALGTAGSLDAVRAAFAAKTGAAGEKLGNNPKYLLVPACLRRAALLETTALVAGTTDARANTDISAIVNPFLAQAATAAQSFYYLIADPNLVDTITVAFLQGNESPSIMEYDAGAVAKRSWKIMLPFVAAPATATIGGTVFTPGIQQGSGAA